MDLSEDASPIARRRRDERGATAVEYALIVALIAAVIVGTVAVLGGQVVGLYQAATQGW